MTHQIIRQFSQKQLRKDLPSFKIGDVIRVYQKVKEGNKQKTQPFEGIVIAQKHGKGINATFTLRRTSKGYGVEKIFPLHSPIIEKIEIIKRAGRVRRAKLYWIRTKTDREIRKKLRLEQPPTLASKSQAKKEVSLAKKKK